MSIVIRRKIARRRVLRGTLGAGSFTLALPFLDCMLDENGAASAATGARLPVRFGTWYWGMGHTPDHAVITKPSTGLGIGFLGETEALKPYENLLSFFGGFQMPLDGRSNYTHFTGWVGSRTGAIPQRVGDIPATTLDLLIADVIGNDTRFKTINASSAGIARENYSARNTDSRGAAEISPVALYAQIFGPDFVDPNKADFKPDAGVMIDKSVLSAFRDESQTYFKTVGASDRARLDEYFTAVRQVENRLALQLEKPAPNEACVRPTAPKEMAADSVPSVREIPHVIDTHEIMAKLLAMAVACNQTKVFNMVFTDNFGNVRRKGETYTHHLLTHSEAIVPSLGYQPMAYWFGQQCNEGLATFIKTFQSIREGAGTLLDNCLIFASSETNFAKVHSVDGIPIWFAGKAGGRVKTGYHVIGGGDPISRVGLTAMKIMGVTIDKWGTRSMQTAKPLTEIMV